MRSETALAEGAVSVSYAAVALARKIFGNLKGRTVLVKRFSSSKRVGSGAEARGSAAPEVAAPVQRSIAGSARVAPTALSL